MEHESIDRGNNAAHGNIRALAKRQHGTELRKPAIREPEDLPRFPDRRASVGICGLLDKLNDQRHAALAGKERRECVDRLRKAPVGRREGKCFLKGSLAVGVNNIQLGERGEEGVLTWRRTAVFAKNFFVQHDGIWLIADRERALLLDGVRRLRCGLGLRIVSRSLGRGCADWGSAQCARQKSRSQPQMPF